MLQIVECPRDAMQGLHDFVPTLDKARYINALLQVGFHTVDFGSFVSPKAIPQMRDTAEVLSKLDLSATRSRLLAIVANFRGAKDALSFDEIDCLGFPLSVSETFQQRNTNKSVEQALQQVQEIHNSCEKHGKTLVVYVSMGFGNPYGDPYSPEIVADLVEKLAAIGVRIVALADTVGSSQPETIQPLFSELIPHFPDMTIGAHFHSVPETAYEKLQAAYEAGCRRFDGAVGGMGGCPMAKDDLTGNIPTEQILGLADSYKLDGGFDREAFEAARQIKSELFD